MSGTPLLQVRGSPRPGPAPLATPSATRRTGARLPGTRQVSGANSRAAPGSPPPRGSSGFGFGSGHFGPTQDPVVPAAGSGHGTQGAAPERPLPGASGPDNGRSDRKCACALGRGGRADYISQRAPRAAPGLVSDCLRVCFLPSCAAACLEGVRLVLGAPVFTCSSSH